MSKRVNRCDIIPLQGKPTYNDQGFLFLPAVFTRSGILNYTQPDGIVIREFRPPEEIQKFDALESLIAATVTDLHPPERKVTSENVQELSIGHVVGEPSSDGKYVEGKIVVTHQDAIEKVKSGKLKEVSPGFTCYIEDTPGEYEGEPYDVIQRDLQFNHLALGPVNWGRSGSDVAIRVDSDTSVCVYTINNDKGDNAMAAQIKIDGIPYPIESAQEAYDRYAAKRDAEQADIVNERDELKGRLDAIEKELGETKVKLEEAMSQEKLDTLIQERVDLETKARKVLGDDADLKGLSPRDVRLKVLKALEYKIDKDASDGFLHGVFEAKIDSYKSDSDDDFGDFDDDDDDLADNAKRRRDSAQDELHEYLDSPKARQKINQKYEDMWKQPCTVSRQKGA